VLSIGEEDTMSLRKVTITSKDISPKQWSVLLLELDVQAPGIRKVVKLGTKKYDAKD